MIHGAAQAFKAFTKSACRSSLSENGGNEIDGNDGGDESGGSDGGDIIMMRVMMVMIMPVLHHDGGDKSI